MSNPRHHQRAVWIASDAELRRCCDQLASAPMLAVDTEFMRSHTFYPQLALVQLYGGGEDCYLVDPLAISDFTPLCERLEAAGQLKVFHSCSEDLGVLNDVLHCVPDPIIDTQLAAGLLGYGASRSYAALVEEIFDVALEKGETRSDWLRRPLSDAQRRYAIQDVEFLPALAERLQGALERRQRWDWLREDCAALVAQARQPSRAGDYYRRIKSAWKLGRAELAVLARLSDWRERQCRERDLPRNHLLHEKVLWNLARSRPRSLAELSGVEGLEARKIRRVGRELVAVIDEARAVSPEDWPPPVPGPPPVQQRSLMKRLKSHVAALARDLELPPELLARKVDYEYIARAAAAGEELTLPPRMRGWRRTVVGEDLLRLARQYREPLCSET